jgi:hypothetical protein
MSSVQKQNNEITVKLVGGLGNQLFGYFAGLDVAVHRNLELRIDISDIKNKLTVHNSSIESFSLHGSLFSRPIKNKFVLRLRNRIHKILRKQIASNYFSNLIGYDPNIYDVPRGVTLNGYFQTHIHYRNVSKLIKEISLVNPSGWYLKKLDYINNNKVLAIHVRRGDYEKYANDYGLLSSNYYKAALELMRNYYNFSEIWVFSDDIDKARKLLQDIVGENVEWVDPTEIPDDAEALMLMSRAKSLIIANSTFSWWAAIFNSNNGCIIAPEKWYRNMEDPNDLIPPEWLKIKSDWV